MSARLEETDASRRRLLADVSHELRTPLTVMQGTLEGILDGLYPADEAHLVPVLEETRVLARLIDDLRTLSLSEAGVLRLHREPTDLARLIQEAVAGTIAPPPTTPAWPSASRRRATCGRSRWILANSAGHRQPRRQRPALHTGRRTGLSRRRPGCGRDVGEGA